ncbi:MAG: leucine-rich repeat domain-containing protein [Lachnospiraceae bacterium]|nr:leucine-rich repeat domain-containing protein [Lachnospiraceae bacterium]
MKNQESKLYKIVKIKSKYISFVNVILSIVLIITVFFGISFVQPKQVEANEKMLSNPRIVPDSSMEAGQNVTWDCIWFGSYPQVEVVPDNEEYTALAEELLQTGDLIKDSTLYQTLQLATGWDMQGDIIIDGSKYRRIKKEDAIWTSDSFDYYKWKNETEYHYFKYQPIKWRVLSVNGTEAFLLADKALDVQPYNTVYEVAVTWEESTIRSWLNGYGASSNIQNQDYSKKNFINTAFGMSGQQAVKETVVDNKNTVTGKIDGGNNTNDKLFFLSSSETYTNTANRYGFVSKFYKCDEARRSGSSVYAKAMGIVNDIYTGRCYWWLRSPEGTGQIACANYDGAVWPRYSNIDYRQYGVRPALNLDLAASSNLWSYAGTVCSIDYADKLEKGSKDVDKDTKAVYKITGTGKNKTVEYVKNKKKDIYNVIIPDTVRLKGKTYKVVSVGKNAFKGREKLKTVKIGKNVRLIGKNAFSGCTGLKNVVIGENVQTIGADAFSNCTALVKIIIPSKVKKIGAKAFYKCRNLKYIVVKTKKLSAKSIGNKAFGEGAVNIKIKMDKTKKKLYSKIFTARGISEKVLYIPV